jgi:hypothetical protein
MPEPITYTRPFEPLSLPETIELNFTDLGLLQIMSEETGVSYEELIRTSIKHLYHNRHSIFHTTTTIRDL